MSRVFKSVNLFEYVKQYKPTQTKSQVKYQKKFIKKAKLVHGDKYDYSLVVYNHSRKKIKIICPIHGEFEQTPDTHLSGGNCQKCSCKYKHTTKSWIKKAKLIHGDKYDYSKVTYTKAREKVKIICPIHGEFLQSPNKHLAGQGCPICQLKNAKYIQGQYHPKYPEKYDGNINNIIYRSSFELKAFQMIEDDETIVSWGSETVVIPYEFDGKIHKYYMDLKLVIIDQVILIEVKPYNKTIRPEYSCYIPEWNQNQAKWKAAREYCDSRGWEFKIWTEKELNI